MMFRLLVLNGPNLNLLGLREPHIYGAESLDDLGALLESWAAVATAQVDMRHSNHEGELIDWLHEAREGADGVILNPGGLTHTSVSLADAVAAIPTPVAEVHLSNIHAREDYRARSYIAGSAIGVIAGFGLEGYRLAAEALLHHHNKTARKEG